MDSKPKEDDMHAGICAKCQSAKVYEVVGAGTDLEFRIGVMTSIVIAHFICSECGFTELYVTQNKDRERVKKKGLHVTPRITKSTSKPF